MRKTTLIGPKPTIASYLVEAWQYRRIALYIAWRDILVRFKQTVIGVVWVIVRPLAVALIFAFVFGRVAGLETEGPPFVLFVLVALLPWQFFAAVVAQGAESITGNAGMVTKIYFPRILLPISITISAAVDFAIGLVVLAAIMLILRQPVGLELLLAFPLILLLCLGAFGAATILATLNAVYRDVRQVVPFAIQLGLFISPIGYSTAAVPERYLSLYCLNPLVGFLEALRSSVLGTNLTVPPWAVGWSIVCFLSLAVFGLILLARRESSLMDVI